MNYPLDTHTFLWILCKPEVLPARVLSIVQDRSATLLVSIATPWEMAIKVASGKLNAADILDNFEAAVTRRRFSVLKNYGSASHIERSFAFLSPRPFRPPAGRAGAGFGDSDCEPRPDFRFVWRKADLGVK
jgi:PIN domain nuclease of toxin-antitoxin system